MQINKKILESNNDFDKLIRGTTFRELLFDIVTSETPPIHSIETFKHEVRDIIDCKPESISEYLED